MQKLVLVLYVILHSCGGHWIEMLINFGDIYLRISVTTVDLTRFCSFVFYTGKLVFKLHPHINNTCYDSM